MPFSVVELHDGVVLVPTTWIINLGNNKYVCYYPPSEKTSKLNQMISKLINPDLTWKQYDVKKYLIRTSKYSHF